MDVMLQIGNVWVLIYLVGSFRIKWSTCSSVIFQSRHLRFYCIFYFPLFCNFLSNLFDTFEECEWPKENMYSDILYTLVSHLIKSCVICKSESLGWELHCVLTTERLLPVSLKAICFRLNTFMDELKYNTTSSFPTRKVFYFYAAHIAILFRSN